MNKESQEYIDKLMHYATAKRITAQTLSQYIDGDFVTSWIGKVRGKPVSGGGKFRFDTKVEALQFAREWRDGCIKEAKSRGLME